MDRERIDRIRKKVDIIDLISRYVSLKKAGNSYKGICPFHEDNDPSLTVDPTKKLWHCFGCGAGGDVFNFLMEIENIPFPDAVRELAQQSGVKIPEKNESSTKSKLTKLMNEANEYFHANLLRRGVGKQARRYLESRGYGEKVVKEFSLGYSLNSWNSLTNKFRGKYGLPALEKVGLVSKSKEGKYYDRFRNRLIFPIRSAAGKVIAFGGRILASEEEAPKYLNSPNSPLFQKGETFYGLAAARRSLGEKDQAILVEGYTDVIAPASKGISNVVASMGTSLTTRQANLIARYVSEVIIAYDRDQAGQQATLKGLKLLRNKGMRVKVAKIPPDKDPADIIENQGATKFKELLENPQEFHKFYLNVLESQHDLSTVEGREEALSSSTEFLSDIESPPLRHELIDRLKDMLRVSASDIRQRIKSKTHKLTDQKDLAVERTQEGLSLDEWLLHLLVKGEISVSSIRKENLLEELKPTIRPLAEKIVEGRKAGKGLEEIIKTMGEKERNKLSRVSLAELDFVKTDSRKASEEVVKQFIKKRKLPRLKKRWKKAIKEENTKEIKDLQDKISAQQRKLNKLE